MRNLLPYAASALAGAAAALALVQASHGFAAIAPLTPLAVPEGSFLYLVFANTPAGRDKEFGEAWDAHMAAIAKMPGIVSAQRFMFQPRPGRQDPHFRHLAAYLIKGDPEAAIGQVGPGVASGKIPPLSDQLLIEKDLPIYRPVQAALINDPEVATRSPPLRQPRQGQR